jgi:hypothetical protein
VFCIGLAGLSRALVRTSRGGRSDWAVVATLATVGLSLPLLAYCRLLYPDILLFTIATWAGLAILADRPYLAVILAWLLPIVHIRSLPLALGLIAIVAIQTATAERSKRTLMRVAGLSVALAFAFAAIQLRLYGTLTGPAFSTTQPSFGTALERLGFSLFDVRQGLLTYAPLYVFSLAGLIAGSLRRDRICGCALGLLATYVFTFMWSDASESWPARFWVTAVPFLAVGLQFWLRGCTTVLSYAMLVPAFAVQASNLVLFELQPAWFLENRRSSLTYAVLDKVTHVNFGLLLPIDGGASQEATYAAPLAFLLPSTAILVMTLVLYRANPRSRIAGTAGLVGLVLMLVPFAVCATRTLPAAAYAVTSVPSRGALEIVLVRPTNVSAVQLDAVLPLIWAQPIYPITIRVTCRSRYGRVAQSLVPGRALILTPACRHAVSIRLAADPPARADGLTSTPNQLTIMEPTFFAGIR